MAAPADPDTPFAPRNRPLLSLSADDLGLLLPDLTPVDLPQGLVLAELDEPIHHVFFPESGMVSFVMFTPEGQSVEAGTIGREGIVSSTSVLGTGISLVQSVVQIPGAGYRMDAARFQQAVERSRGLRHMANLCAEGLTAQALTSIGCMAFHSVEERLARWLLTARDQIEDNTILLTQEFLAQMLGVQRTTVTLVAHTFQSAGLIQYRRGRVEIRDAAALRDASCDCYSQTRQRWDRILPSPL